MYQLDRLKADVQRATDRYQKKVGQRDLLLEQKEKQEKKLQLAVDQLGVFDLVQILLQKTSDYARQVARQRIEEIVTKALNVVFDRDYNFKIEVRTKGNQPVAEYYLESEEVTTQLKPPDYDRGGGVADVISLSLRLAVGELSGNKGPIFLDEVGKHVSQEYAPNVAYFLKEYSEKFNRQIILITHNAHLAEIGDQSFAVRQKNGESVVTQI